jgi:hypothetical protein
MKHYEFPITLSGDGNTPDEAWEDAVEGFMLDPGITPDEFTVEDEDNKEVQQ